MVGNNILVTGGAGYIGSHTVLKLLLGGYNTVVIQNLDNSSLNRVKDLAGYKGQYLTFHQVDLGDKPALEKVFSESKFDAVIHFAGQKAGECVAENLIRTITLLVVMAAHGCKKLVVSTSATPKEVPCTEESPLSEMSHYGPIQVFTKDICRDFLRGDPEWRIIMLRYFNPVGAHPSGRFGEYPYHILIMPYLQQVADYTAKDGASVRDYLQVVDLADGHICALQKLDDTEIGCQVYNLGTGKGTTVLEMVGASEKASGMKNPLVRGPGDPIEVDGVSEKSVVSGIQFTKENIIERIDVVLKFLKIFSDLRSKQILVDDVKRQDLLLIELKAFLTAAKIAKDIKGEVENGGEDGFGSQIAGVKSLTKSMEKRYQDVISRTEWECKREWL